MNPRAAGTQPAPIRLCKRVSGRGFFTETGLIGFWAGRGLFKKPESDPEKKNLTGGVETKGRTSLKFCILILPAELKFCMNQLQTRK